MHDSPHLSQLIAQVYLESNNLSGGELADKLDVTASTLNRILTGTSCISPEMAIRLSKALGRSPESWLAMQDNHNPLARQVACEARQGGESPAHRGLDEIGSKVGRRLKGETRGLPKWADRLAELHSEL